VLRGKSELWWVASLEDDELGFEQNVANDIDTNIVTALKTSNAVSIIETCGRVIHVVARDDTGVVADAESELWKLGVAREEIQSCVPIIIESSRDSVVVSSDNILWEEEKLSSS
jgi:hypothetical protein